MLCIWQKFRDHYWCMVTVLVNVRTTKHSSYQFRFIFIVFNYCQWFDLKVVGCCGSRVSFEVSRDP